MKAREQHIYQHDDLSGSTLCGRTKVKGVSLTRAIQYNSCLDYDNDGWCNKCAAKARAIVINVKKQLGVKS